MKPLAIYYWKDRKRLAYLQNAYDISYSIEANALWRASFKLPYNDEKNSYCKPYNLVEIWDVNSSGNDKYIGLFRIMPVVKNLDGSSDDVTYELEHVFGTLLDEVHIGFHEYGGKNQKTKALIKTILKKQVTLRWNLNICEYDEDDEHIFEDTNLLDCIYRIAETLPENYYWEFNTKQFPWELNLKKVSTKIPKAEIRYKKNILGIKETIDLRDLATRIWPYGAKIDGKRVDITSIVPSGYLESASAIKEYGVISTIFIDDKFINPRLLYKYAVKMLEIISEPRIKYELDIKTFLDTADLYIGDPVRVVTDDGLNKILTVQQIKKDNVAEGANGKIVIGRGTVNYGIIQKRLN